MCRKRQETRPFTIDLDQIQVDRPTSLRRHSSLSRDAASAFLDEYQIEEYGTEHGYNVQ